MPSETNKAFWLIRSNMNRKILNKQLKLWDIIKTSKLIGKIEFELPAENIPQRRHGKQK